VEAMIYIQQYTGTGYSTKIVAPDNPWAYDFYAKRKVSNADGWVKLEVEFTTHRDARYVSISLNVNGQYRVMYFDDVSMVLKP
jgi:hypothetical protein